jgi:hypothetical protein
MLLFGVIFVFTIFITFYYSETISSVIFYILSKKEIFLMFLFLFTILYGYCVKKNIYRSPLLDYIYTEFGHKKIKNFKFKSKNYRNVSQLSKKIIASDQQWKCNNCGNILDYSYEVDHIIPLYKGGSNETSNLVALCRNCHGKKTLNEMTYNNNK